jgi:hypothetical protein
VKDRINAISLFGEELLCTLFFYSWQEQRALTIRTPDIPPVMFS